ncbi:MAG: hypothetical protein JXB23_04825 [Candidatus Aminicenantes bacterium]|nr:hypothetical protein [Candidatus Aminicenantes bacterium]
MNLPKTIAPQQSLEHASKPHFTWGIKLFCIFSGDGTFRAEISSIEV